MFQLVLETISDQLDLYTKENKYIINPIFYNEMIYEVIRGYYNQEEIINRAIVKTQMLYQSLIMEINDCDCIEIPAYLSLQDLAYIIFAYYGHDEGYEFLYTMDSCHWIGMSLLHMHDTLEILGHESKMTYFYKYHYQFVLKKGHTYEHMFTIDHMDDSLKKKYDFVRSQYIRRK